MSQIQGSNAIGSTLSFFPGRPSIFQVTNENASCIEEIFVHIINYNKAWHVNLLWLEASISKATEIMLIRTQHGMNEVNWLECGTLLSNAC